VRHLIPIVELAIASLGCRDQRDRENCTSRGGARVCWCGGICERRRYPRATPRGSFGHETSTFGSRWAGRGMGRRHRCALAYAIGSLGGRDEGRRHKRTPLASPSLPRHWHRCSSRTARRARAMPAGFVDDSGSCCTALQLRVFGWTSCGRTSVQQELPRSIGANGRSGSRRTYATARRSSSRSLAVNPAETPSTPGSPSPCGGTLGGRGTPRRSSAP
jgi:hypothetical protein